MNTRVGCHSLLQGIFLTQGLNLGVLHCSQILYRWSHQGSLSKGTRVYTGGKVMLSPVPRGWLSSLSQIYTFSAQLPESVPLLLIPGIYSCSGFLNKARKIYQLKQVGIKKKRQTIILITLVIIGQKFVWVFPEDVMKKLEWTFQPTQ